MSNQSKKNTAGKLNTLEEPEHNPETSTSEDISDNPTESRASRQIETALTNSEIKSENKLNSIRSISLIHLNEIIEPDMPMRDKIDGNELNSLAESIKRIGLMNPVTLKKTKKGYEIIAGVRRYFAHKLLFMEKITAIVVDATDKETLLQRWAENMERSDISPWEEARYLVQIQKKYSLTQEEIAKYINKSTAYVNDRLQILGYQTQIYDALIRGEIEFSVARELNKIKDLAKMLDALNWCMRTGANARTAKQYREDMNRDTETALPELSPGQGTQFVPTYVPDKIYMNCNICGQKVEMLQTYLIRVCHPCNKQIIDAVNK